MRVDWHDKWAAEARETNEHPKEDMSPQTCPWLAGRHEHRLGVRRWADNTDLW